MVFEVIRQCCHCSKGEWNSECSCACHNSDPVGTKVNLRLPPKYIIKERKKMKFDWVEIRSASDGDAHRFTERANVIGGWLVREIYYCVPAGERCETMAFVPDANHEWVIEE